MDHDGYMTIDIPEHVQVNWVTKLDEMDLVMHVAGMIDMLIRKRRTLESITNKYYLFISFPLHEHTILQVSQSCCGILATDNLTILTNRLILITSNRIATRQ